MEAMAVLPTRFELTRMWDMLLCLLETAVVISVWRRQRRQHFDVGRHFASLEHLMVTQTASAPPLAAAHMRDVRLSC